MCLLAGPPADGIASNNLHASVKVIATPERIKQRYLSLIRDATDEVLLLFPTINAIHREYSIGILGELQNAVKRGVRVRILSAEDDFIMDKLSGLRASGIIVRRIETPTEEKFKMLIVDKKFAFIVETRDDSKFEFKDAVGTALLSSSKATVLPYVTIFESFWRETDLYERARESDRIKDEFVNIAAHELRNPIMPIIAGIELNTDLIETIRGKIDEKTFEKLIDNSQLVAGNATRLLRLSEDILQVSRIENGTFALNLQIADAGELVSSALTDIQQRYEAERPNVKLKLDSKLGRDGLKLYVDASKYLQTLMNLLDNAMKFTKVGEVVVTASVSDKELLVAVRDSGVGVSPDIKDRLFEKFATRSFSGTGLGLYLSKTIVEAHGGRIWYARNTDGNGATFGFAIPTDLPPSLTAESAKPIADMDEKS